MTDATPKCCRDTQLSVPATLRIGKCERGILTYLSSHDDGKFRFLVDAAFESGIQISRSVESSYNRAAHRLERLGFIETRVILEWGTYPRSRLRTNIRLTDAGRKLLDARKWKSTEGMIV
jgi:hypothetical protein